MIEHKDIDVWFKHHKPTPLKVDDYKELRIAAKTFAQVIFELTPGGLDQTAAIRKVREAMMTANAAIACEPPK